MAADSRKDRKKLFYRIGEACRELDIQPYVLRYWETEFTALSPSKSRSGQRVYNERDLSIIRRIKELLYGEGFTIAGAKKRLESELAQDKTGGGAAEEGETNEPAGAGPWLDTRAEERIETLRRGIARALDEAREILDLLAATERR